MKSPFTGGKASLRHEIRVFDYRREAFNIMYHYYQCEDTQEQFTTTELDALNINQVHNKYRAKYGIPFVDDIRYTREKYALSAAKMSEVLGLGANVYRHYESGEMPSVATGRLIRIAEDPAEFNKLLELSRNVLDAHDFERVQKKLQQVPAETEGTAVLANRYIFRSKYPDEFNGYRTGSMSKLGYVVQYLAAALAPFVTGMNKLLFYIDFRHYQQHGRSITGISYKAIEWGPVPRNYGAMYNFLADERYIDIEEREVGEMIVWKEKMKSTADGSPLEEEEIRTLESVVAKMKGKNTRQIVDMSHEESAWKENVKHKAFISYEYSFMLQDF